MANRKYDYSEDVQQPAESASEMAKTSETEEITAVSAEEMRRKRLEQRNDALTNEFRKLKPEIADAHRQLNHLIEGIGAYAGTMQNLQSLLESLLPIKFAENDKLALKEELHAIANDTITKIQNEHEKANRDIHRNDNCISMTHRTCKLNCVMLYSPSISSVGEWPAPRGGTTRPDERKITII